MRIGEAMPQCSTTAQRWSGNRYRRDPEGFGESGDGDLLAKTRRGACTRARTRSAGERLALPHAVVSPLDVLLGQRVTCRNFDPARALSREQFATVLQRAWGARAVQDFAPEVPLLKKGVPSAGGLHATECYLLVQRVDGIAPGL